ncbi:hypothetical protein ACFXP7_01690 [Microbacterium sp. P06]|uniref:hypothetical protein n=1 Tax=Microbacterium sp. P06 TaxID=3366949 RepID=UPI0037473069
MRTSSMNLGRLLRQLVLREKFRRSDTTLILGDDTHQTVKSGCVHIQDIEDTHVNRYRVYWGVLRYPRPRDDGGAWLNTGYGSPTIIVEPDEVEGLLDTAGVDELEDLAGSFFAFMGRLRVGPSGRRFLFLDDLGWFAARPFSEDEQLN